MSDRAERAPTLSLDELSATVVSLQSRIAELEGQRSPLERVFPGVWEKTWSGRGDGFDASGTERFVVSGNELRIIASTTGIRTRWTVEVEPGAPLRLTQRHSQSDFRGFAPISIALQGSATEGYQGTELVDGHEVAVQYVRLPDSARELPAKPRKQRSREEWRALVAEQRAKLAAQRERIVEERARRAIEREQKRAAAVAAEEAAIAAAQERAKEASA